MAYISFNSGTQNQLNNTPITDGLIFIDVDAQCLTMDGVDERIYFNTFIINDEKYQGIEDDVYSADAIESSFIPYAKSYNYCDTDYIVNTIGENTYNIGVSEQIKNIYDATAIELESSDYVVENRKVPWSGSSYYNPIGYTTIQVLTLDASKLKSNTRLILLISEEFYNSYEADVEAIKMYDLSEFTYDATNNTYSKEFDTTNTIYKIFII